MCFPKPKQRHTQHPHSHETREPICLPKPFCFRPLCFKTQINKHLPTRMHAVRPGVEIEVKRSRCGGAAAMGSPFTVSGRPKGSSNSLQKRAYTYCTHSKMRTSERERERRSTTYIRQHLSLDLLFWAARARGEFQVERATSTRHTRTQAACVCRQRRRREAKRLPRSITLVTKQWNACGGPCVCVSQQNEVPLCVRWAPPSQSISATEMHLPAANARKIVKHNKALLSAAGGWVPTTDAQIVCCSLLC